MNKILLLLPTCLYPTNRSSNHGETRFLQYFKGLQKLFEYNSFFIENHIDIILFDNSIDNINDIPDIIKNVFPSNVNIIVKIVNSYGCINKGAGLIEHWLYNKQEIKKYDWIIHFEPRQLLKSNQLIEKFLKNPRNLFSFNTIGKHFNTGLFCIESKHLLDYIEKTDLNHMVNRYISIEDDLYNYFIRNQIQFDIVEKMDLLWFESKTGTYEM